MDVYDSVEDLQLRSCWCSLQCWHHEIADPAVEEHHFVHVLAHSCLLCFEPADEDYSSTELPTLSPALWYNWGSGFVLS